MKRRKKKMKKNVKKSIIERHTIHERKPTIPMGRTFTDRKKKARKNACRGKRTED